MEIYLYTNSCSANIDLNKYMTLDCETAEEKMRYAVSKVEYRTD